MSSLIVGGDNIRFLIQRKQAYIKENNNKNISFGSAGYIWGDNNKTLVFHPAQNGKHDLDLFNEYISSLNKLKSQNPELVKDLIKKFVDQTIVTGGEVQTDKNSLNLKAGTKTPGLEEKLVAYILEQLAQHKTVDLNVGKENFQTIKDKLEHSGFISLKSDPRNGILTVQRMISTDVLEIPEELTDLWKSIINIEQNGQGNGESRSKLINDTLHNQNNFTAPVLQTLDGLLKAVTIGIVSDNGNIPVNTADNLIANYIQTSQEIKKATYSQIKSICQQLPSANSGGQIVRIPNKGPVRHGILALKSAALRSDKWDEIGEKGIFIKSIHQLAHQRPAPELGYVCMAFAQYIRSNGNLNEFDKVLKNNNVSFEDYFVKMGNEIKGNSDWNNISVEKPKHVPGFSDDQIRQALERHGWLDRNKYNINELMSRPEPKLATFFQVYGETIINTLKGMGIELTPKSSHINKYLGKDAFSNLEHINKIRKEAFDNKQESLLPELLIKTVELRSFISKEIQNSTDVKKTQALIELDNQLESITNTVSMNMLAKAPTDKGLYKLDNNTENLLLALIDNYALSHLENSQELEMIRNNLKAAFSDPNRNTSDWAEHTLVTLNQLQRLITEKSNDISNVYRPIARNLSKINMSDNIASNVVEQLADGILRGSLLFDISQVTTGFRNQVRKLASASPWQTLSAGSKIGRVIHAKSMDHLEEVIKKERESGQDVKSLICFVDSLIGAEEPPNGVKAIITPKVIDTLAHLGVRCRQENIVFSCLDDSDLYRDLISKHVKNDSYININVSEGNVIIKPASKNDAEIKQKQSDNEHSSSVKVKLPLADRDFKTPVLALNEIKFNTSGPKAYNISKLASAVPVPESLSIPFSVFDKVLNDPINAEILDKYNKNLITISKKEKINDLSVIEELKQQQKLVEQLQFSQELLETIKKALLETVPADTKFIITRSSTNGEDLKDFSGAGLYESFPGATKEKIDLYIKKVWASKWGKRAYDARVKAGIPHEDLAVSVLVQSCIDAKYAFVTHTTNPLTHNPDEVYIDLVQGLGEALVSGEVPGVGYSFIYNKKTGEVKRSHLADKTYKLVPDGKGSLVKKLTDYKNDVFAKDKTAWEGVIKQIGEYSANIEKLYEGKPQDIEGVIKDSNDKIYIVQTRDQLGVKPVHKSKISFGSIKNSIEFLDKPVVSTKKSINILV
ncbi:MAG: PEP/pyruvate-binding domain-containing protein [Cyanobacteriota bacterium]